MISLVAPSPPGLVPIEMEEELGDDMSTRMPKRHRVHDRVIRTFPTLGILVDVVE